MKQGIDKYFLYFCLVGLACQSPDKKEPALFEILDKGHTGLSFVNKLTPTPAFNMFKYMYFYNGAGIGAGDFNNDGLVDLFFSANQGPNQLYLNKGNLQFREVTTASKIPHDGGWSTGVSVIDINNDGLLDIYVCRVGQYETLKGENQLLVCKGIDQDGVPFYKNEAAQYGLNFSGFSTQAAFVDYDLDGDLDCFLLNHSVHQNGTFAPRNHFMGTYHPLSGDRFFRNDGKKFTDVTKQTGINSSAISYGLGIAVADINLDGYPDIYAGNDFHENDYLYINQKNGTFKEELNDHIMHTSQFSMGVDIADINNDGYPEIISMDMLPSDPYMLKRSLGEDEYDLFQYKIKAGYNHQYTRNNLQWNRKNGMFSEVGLYSGIYASDWSWAPLWMDFNNDGLKDLFISNGIPKRMNDMDYVNFISNRQIQDKLAVDRMAEKDMALVNQFPEIKIPNRLFQNKGQLNFVDIGDRIGNQTATFSNGSVYADLDNDGDLDIVVNNIDESALVYRNTSNDKKDKAFVTIPLKGTSNNVNAIGAKVVLFGNGGIRTYEKNPVRGFQSSMEIPLHIGLDQTRVDSVFLIWPDNTYQRLFWKPGQQTIPTVYKKGLPVFDYKKITGQAVVLTQPMEDLTAAVRLNYQHTENSFGEFDREPLIPHMISTEGPALAVADVNRDGREDVFLGAAKEGRSALFLQEKNGIFRKQAAPLEKDTSFEDVDAVWADVNNDTYPDLIVASGGNQFFGPDPHLAPRLYLNDGQANFTRQDQAFDSIYVNASCVVAHDFTGDGFIDLFIGGRSVPWEYGATPTSYLLQNNGKGNFKNTTRSVAPELERLGMITQAIWFDLDQDGRKDLIVCTEWDGIYAFLHSAGKWTKKVLTDRKGWWNFVLPADLDQDGDIDLIAGNLGLNSRLKATMQEPVRLYYQDFDDNGKKEQILTYYLNGRELPFANKDELQKQIPSIKKKFLLAEGFAKATLTEIFGAEKLAGAKVLEANYFFNALLINHGNLNFKLQALPWELQVSPLKDAVITDANQDAMPDVLLMGNYYDNNIQMGRHDADFGTLLVNQGKNQFNPQPIPGLAIRGQVRHIKPIQIMKKQAFLLARNRDAAMVIGYKKFQVKK